jgi:hypothetical protein
LDSFKAERVDAMLPLLEATLWPQPSDIEMSGRSGGSNEAGNGITYGLFSGDSLSDANFTFEVRLMLTSSSAGINATDECSSFSPMELLLLILLLHPSSVFPLSMAHNGQESSKAFHSPWRLRRLIWTKGCLEQRPWLSTSLMVLQQLSNNVVWRR